MSRWSPGVILPAPYEGRKQKKVSCRANRRPGCLLRTLYSPYTDRTIKYIHLNPPQSRFNQCGAYLDSWTEAESSQREGALSVSIAQSAFGNYDPLRMKRKPASSLIVQRRGTDRLGSRSPYIENSIHFISLIYMDAEKRHSCEDDAR